MKCLQCFKEMDITLDAHRLRLLDETRTLPKLYSLTEEACWRKYANQMSSTCYECFYQENLTPYEALSLLISKLIHYERYFIPKL